MIDNGVNINAPHFADYSISQSDHEPSSPHGSLMLPLILGTAPGQDHSLDPGATKILSLNVADHSASEQPLADSINSALDQHADLISISMGVRNHSEALEHAAQRAEQQGVPIVAAAGNVGFMLPDYPARIPSVIAVGASDAHGEFLSTSSKKCLDVSVVAHNIPSLRPDGEEIHISGTSVATALTTHWLATAMIEGHEITHDSIPNPAHINGGGYSHISVTTARDASEKSQSCENN